MLYILAIGIARYSKGPSSTWDCGKEGYQWFYYGVHGSR